MTKTNIIVGCIYRHATMDLNEFNCYYLNPLLEKLAKEQKTVFLLGDFNVDLLKYVKHKATNEFIDSVFQFLFLPYIIQPTRITSHLKSISDNIFSSYISHEIISLFPFRTNHLEMSLMKKTLLRKLNLRLNIKATETCYLH